MRRVAGSLIVLIAALSTALPAFAQADPQRKLQEEERRREMDERARANADLKQDFLWNYGGWLHAEVTRLDDPPDRDHRTFRYADLRLWGELVYDERYTAYVRLQGSYTDFNSHDQFAGEHDNIFGARVDQAWIDADFSSDDTGFRAKAGRQYESIGRGLLLNGVYYAGQLAWTQGAFGVKLLGAHTIIHDDDLDQSLPNFRDSHRLFIGLEGDWKFSGDHTLYAMALVEHDLNDEESASQKWDYNSDYVGLGAHGTVIGDLSYAVEAVYELGKSAAAGSTQFEAIRAFAFTASLDCAWRIDTSPFFVLEYMYGSGDKDRGSVTDAASGNAPGTKDTGFLSFGFLQTGYSLFPRLSNIHILRVGGSFHPLESVDPARNLELGAFFYYYRKVQSAEPISDPRSSNDNADIGTEVDVLLRWRIFSDLGVFVNYGVFMPGKAYSDTTNRAYLSVGLTYSF